MVEDGAEHKGEESVTTLQKRILTVYFHEIEKVIQSGLKLAIIKHNQDVEVISFTSEKTQTEFLDKFKQFYDSLHFSDKIAEIVEEEAGKERKFHE